jgi:hypothetical protein
MNTKKPSPKQLAANRANAKKSSGPKTPAGLAKSSRNSTRHGLLARTIVLSGESPERFKLLLDDLTAELHPTTAIERSLVENMAVARWRQMRLWAMERAEMTLEMDRQQSEPETTDPNPTHDAANAALAFRNLSDHSRALDLMRRYEASCARQYNNSLDRLLKLRKNNEISKRTQIVPDFI